MTMISTMMHQKRLKRLKKSTRLEEIQNLRSERMLLVKASRLRNIIMMARLMFPGIMSAIISRLIHIALTELRHVMSTSITGVTQAHRHHHRSVIRFLSSSSKRCLTPRILRDSTIHRLPVRHMPTMWMKALHIQTMPIPIALNRRQR